MGYFYVCFIDQRSFMCVAIVLDRYVDRNFETEVETFPKETSVSRNKLFLVKLSLRESETFPEASAAV